MLLNALYVRHELRRGGNLFPNLPIARLAPVRRRVDQGMRGAALVRSFAGRIGIASDAALRRRRVWRERQSSQVAHTDARNESTGVALNHIGRAEIQGNEHRVEEDRDPILAVLNRTTVGTHVTVGLDVELFPVDPSIDDLIIVDREVIGGGRFLRHGLPQ